MDITMLDITIEADPPTFMLIILVFPHKAGQNTACLTVWNQSPALMWSLGRQEGWGKWEGREAGRRGRGKKHTRRWKVGDKDSEEKCARVLEKDPVTEWDGELKERPSWSRCMDGIQEVTGVNWKGFLPLRASLLIMAVEALESSLAAVRTLIIRRHVTAHPCRINTLHSSALRTKHTRVSCWHMCKVCQLHAHKYAKYKYTVFSMHWPWCFLSVHNEWKSCMSSLVTTTDVTAVHQYLWHISVIRPPNF